LAGPVFFVEKDFSFMTAEEKTAFQAAEEIRERLRQSATKRLAVHVPTDYWQEIVKLARRIEIAAAHDWTLAATSLRTDLARTVDQCRDRLAGLFVELDRDPQPVPSLSALYREILGLYQEFEEVEIDLENNLISVTTEPITLEGYFLGRFQICLDWEKFPNPSPYYVKALDPHPAASNDGVTHPHVQDERLCEGDGRAAIARALAEGRLGDFFLLVAQILQTYGKGSAYVELDDWEGASCADCGETVGDNNRYECNYCDVTLCEFCALTCHACDGTYCSGCLAACTVCSESFCSACLKVCRNCHQHVCNNCLTNGLCENCHAKLHPPDDHDSAADEPGGEPPDAESDETAAPEEAVASDV
jgi:hypothetical protein